MTTIKARQRVRSGTTAQWTSANPVLLLGEIGYDVELKQMRIGDGVTNYLSLPFAPLSTLSYLPADVTLPALNMTRVKADASGVEFRTPQQVRESDLGISGPGGSVAATITNLDTHATGGTFFAASTATGLPLAEASVVIHHPADTAARSVQETISLTTGRRFWRRETSAGVWAAWSEVVAEASLAAGARAVPASQPQAEAGTDNSAYMTALRVTQAITVSKVLSLLASSSLGAVGTYAWLARNGDGSALVAGDAYAGSGLVYAGVSAPNAYTYNTALVASGATPAGTWRAMGSANSGDASKGTLFLRIS